MTTSRIACRGEREAARFELDGLGEVVCGRHVVNYTLRYHCHY
jgi:hypothetical protein